VSDLKKDVDKQLKELKENTSRWMKLRRICRLWKRKSGGSKMVTRTEKQAVWALQIKNIAKMLEVHVAEIKNQEESKLQHPEPLASGKLLYATLHWENKRAHSLPDAGSKPAW
jgi:hypothetical protein